MHNLTAVDIFAILKACALLGPFLFAPGYVLGWCCNLFEFRQRRLVLRMLLATPLTIAISPILAYLLARFSPLGLWSFYICTLAGCVLLLVREGRRFAWRPVSRSVRLACLLAALWVVVAIASLMDLQIGDRLYFAVPAFDHCVRTAFTAALAQGVPPDNPFAVHPSAPLRYHYLWPLLCSLPLRLTHIAPRYLVYAGAVWCGLGLMGLVAIGLKFFLRVQSHIERKTVLGIALLAVTGLDILPTLLISIHGRIPADMEWWNGTQITSWADNMLWVPHHLAALIAGFVGFALLRHAVDVRRGRAIAIVFAGAAFSGAVGLSVYVTFTFAVAIAMWMVVLVVRKEWQEAGIFVLAGLIAAAMALPYLLSLRGPAVGGAFVEVHVRDFPLGLSAGQHLGLIRSDPLAVESANAGLLPLNYFLELGFFFAIGVIRLRQLWRREVAFSKNEWAGWTLVTAAFLIGSFLRSSVITNNDLGYRCFLPAQLLLLLWGAIIVHDWRWPQFGSDRVRFRTLSAPGVFVAVLLLLGLLGTTYQVILLRVFPVLMDRTALAGPPWLDSDHQLGQRNYGLRAAYDALDAVLPDTAVVQHNPKTKFFIPHFLYSGRRMAAATRNCGATFGGDPQACIPRILAILPVFETSAGYAGDIDAFCREYGVDVLLAKDTDRAWQNASSWVWVRHPVVANHYVRAFRCGTVTRAQNETSRSHP